MARSRSTPGQQPRRQPAAPLTFSPERVLASPPPTMPELFAQIDAVQKQLNRIQRETVGGSGLTPPQYFLLTQLWERDGRPPKDLAAAAGTSRATITGVVDVLERKELVLRTPNPADRRSTLLRLTPLGRALRKKTAGLERTYDQCCHGLEPVERRALAGLLQKLSDSLGPPVAD